MEVALVKARNEIAQLLAEAGAHSAAGGAVGLLMCQILRQLLYQLIPATLQQDYQVCTG